MKEPSDLFANLLFALSSAFLGLLVLVVCQQASRTRKAMESAVAAATAARTQPSRSYAGVQPAPKSPAPCVPGQIHSYPQPEAPSGAVWFTTGP